MTDLVLRDEALDSPVASEWAGLVGQTAEPLPFVTPAWQRVWLKHFQDGRELRIITARDGERLIGVAPLLFADGCATFVGHHSICDYMDIVVAPGFEAQVARELLARLAADGCGSLDLRGIVATSPTRQALLEAAAAAGYQAACEDEALSPRVELPATWEDYLGRLTKKDRHELRRKLRRLEGGGGVELRIVTKADEVASGLDTLFRLMRVSSHHKEEFLDRPGMEAFFREMVAAMAGEEMLRFYFLTFDGQAVASVLNFDIGGRLYMYNSGYDPAYAHYAVGLMSKTLLIRDAIEQGRTCVDFLRGDESYKYDLGGRDRQVYRLVLKR